MEAKLSAIAGLADSKQRTSRYEGLIDELTASSSTPALQTVVDHLMEESTPQMIARSAITHLSSALKGGASAECFEEVACHLLEKFGASSQSFDDAQHNLRHGLFAHYTAEGDYKEAAGSLAGLNMETSSRAYTEAAKADTYVQIAETYLAADESVDADVYVNKASPLMYAVTVWSVQLRYRVTLSRVLDARRKFLDAAAHYYELSQTANEQVQAGDLLDLLGMAVTCAILAEAGPQRTRILGTLYKDERIHSLDDGRCKVLVKMYREQILRRSEMAAFESSLLPHQRAMGADGLTIPERALIEHNVVAACKIYDNIRFQELGQLLEISADKAERIAAKMVSASRLRAAIDQVDGYLHFDRDAEPLRGWDERIGGVCADVNACLEEIEKKHPALVA